MAVAFAGFDEPHAWLIRGLVEYGWRDTGVTGGALPPGAPGGLNTRALVDSTGREGLSLEMPAVWNGRPMPEDGTYLFQALLTRSQGRLVFLLRCPEANYLQEFPFDPQNPTWTAGYVHQALVQYVPGFVEWRLGGGEVPWAQRVGMPRPPAEPCSVPLAQFLRERLQARRPMELGPAELWWTAGHQPAAATPAIVAGKGSAAAPASGGWSGGPIAMLGKGGGEPVYMSSQARAQATPQVWSPAQQNQVQARARTAAPGYSLMVMSGLGMLQGLLWFFNALYAVSEKEYFATAFSVPLAFALLILGAAALYGGWRYRNIDSKVLPWVSMVYCALVPGCCLLGLPIAGWALKVWLDPVVKAARETGPVAMPRREEGEEEAPEEELD